MGEQDNIHRDFMDEAHQELSESKKMISDLMSYRRNSFKSDQGKMDEYLDKAIDAINHLFNDDLPRVQEPE